MASDLRKKEHSSAISVLLCIAHVLPLACKSEYIIGGIFLDHKRLSRNFHAKWLLDGWNDSVIQPARDAVLNYYKVRVSMSLPTVFALKPIQPNPVYSIN